MNTLTPEHTCDNPSVSSYTRGCRCIECRRERREYDQRRRADNPPQMMPRKGVDAAIVLLLSSGLTVSEIVAIGHVSPRFVSDARDVGHTMALTSVCRTFLANIISVLPAYEARPVFERRIITRKYLEAYRRKWS